ncbi:hypothetical protein CRYUN_Cryun32bG0112100 [Craigia yunnanensis]
MISDCFCLFLLLSLSSFVAESRQLNGNSYKLSSSFSKFHHVDSNDAEGKRWAILIAGSLGYANYRHQADVCHAYQILKNGGLKDDNIIVFMYDDIAFSEYNPRPGIIINKPDGDDVYKGVPKDYTREDVNMNNFFAVILGNKTAIKGGSGKMVNSGPNDRIFIYYTDHGGFGLLGMPSGDDIPAKDLINVLKEKHEAKSYKSMVIYVEACESGSMFEGILPTNLNIYAITAANAKENSWGTYCPGGYPSPPSDFDTCLADLFSISWMEDSDIHDLRNETLEQQYQLVRRRTAVDNLVSSHVMQYGSMRFEKDFLFSYLGTNPKNDHFGAPSAHLSLNLAITSHVVSQHDATLIHFWFKFHRAPEGSAKKAKAHKELLDELSYRKHIDESINQIIKVIFGYKNMSAEILKSVQSVGKPLVDDWNCFKMLVNSFKKHCGKTSRSRYEMKYSGSFANMCNARVDMKQATATIIEACCSSLHSLPPPLLPPTTITT